MSWIVRWQDTEINSDDFLIEDLEQIEKATGTPWSIANPLRDIKVAKAFIAVAMLRAGKSDTQVALALNALTLGTLKTAFDFKPEDEATSESVPTTPKKSRARTSPGSSPTGRATDGSPATPDDSASETSS